MSKKAIAIWALRVWIAFVFVQSLFFKFTGSPETVHIFGVLGEWMGLPVFTAYGAYVVGGAELVASLILLSRYWVWGAVLAFEIMCGAIIFHLFTPLGIEMPVFENGVATGETDGGTLFIMACLVWLSALLLMAIDFFSETSRIRNLYQYLSSRKAD